MNLIDRLRKMRDTIHVPAGAGYEHEVRWSTYNSSHSCNLHLEVFKTQADAHEFARALTEAMRLIQGTFWSSPEIRRKP